ncbi:hypothetical protein C4573_03525 [Candidatus Woesearchaeota archaeon]|nr:MAG: hypothetical protein C4573_03525 [Candidatus Woesearchaeota archaeon]
MDDEEKIPAEETLLLAINSSDLDARVLNTSNQEITLLRKFFEVAGKDEAIYVVQVPRRTVNKYHRLNKTGFKASGGTLVDYAPALHIHVSEDELEIGTLKDPESDERIGGGIYYPEDVLDLEILNPTKLTGYHMRIVMDRRTGIYTPIPEQGSKLAGNSVGARDLIPLQKFRFGSVHNSHLTDEEQRAFQTRTEGREMPYFKRTEPGCYRIVDPKLDSIDYAPEYVELLKQSRAERANLKRDGMTREKLSALVNSSLLHTPTIGGSDKYRIAAHRVLKQIPQELPVELNIQYIPVTQT